MLYIKDPKHITQLKVTVMNNKDKEMTPLKEAFKIITDYYIQLKGWNRSDMDASDYARIHSCTRHLLLKSKGDMNKIKQAMDWVMRQKYMEWNMETVVKKFPEAMKVVPAYQKYIVDQRRYKETR